MALLIVCEQHHTNEPFQAASKMEQKCVIFEDAFASLKNCTVKNLVEILNFQEVSSSERSSSGPEVVET
jgi:hypothetical protein